MIASRKTVDRECGSPKGGVKCIRKVCQLTWRCGCHGGDEGSLGEVLQLLESVPVIRKV